MYILANKKTFRRYGRTSVRDKRSLVRSLDSFTKQYKYAFIEKVSLNDKQEIEFGKLMGLSFSQESQKRIGEVGYGSSMIYSADVALNDLSTQETIANAIDNMISINKKYRYKEALKAILDEYSEQGVSTMFEQSNEENVIQQISKSFECSMQYAKRIYQQLKNRVKYAYVGLYSVNEESTNRINVLLPQYITPYDELKSKINFILKREWLFGDAILNELRARLSEIKKDKTDAYWQEHQEQDIQEKIEEYFGIDILDTDDYTYYDAVEFLQFTYLSDMYENAPYPDPNYTPYEYEFITEYAIENFTNESSAKSYILWFNSELEQVDNDADDGEEQKEREKQLYNAPIDAETYYDSTVQDIYRESAASPAMQWNKFYETLLDGIISDNESRNVYKRVCEFSREILSRYLKLEEEGMYLENGVINESCKTLKDMFRSLEEDEGLNQLDTATRYAKIREAVAMKKRENRLLYKTVNQNGIIYALEDFNYETLQFRGYKTK